MYYLNEKEFMPLVIFLSVIFVPPLILLFIVLFFEFELVLLLTTVGVLLIYIFSIIISKKATNAEGHYLIVHDDSFEICYPNIGNGTHALNVKFSDVIEIEYFRITSIRGWCQLLGYVVPKCTYITYLNNGIKTTDLIGFFDLKDIKSITSKNGIRLKIR